MGAAVGSLNSGAGHYILADKLPVETIVSTAGGVAQ